jgi:hypothetical protein
MRASLFDSFATMIEGMPVEGVFRAVEIECKMLEDDLAYNREESLEEALSIESFRVFLRAAKDGLCMFSVTPLPVAHASFFKKTVERLILAKELPANAMKLFDKAYTTTPNLVTQTVLRLDFFTRPAVM